MSRYHSYINSAKDILTRYRGEEPLSSYLKKYFSSDKKFGSRDRKEIAQLCYCYFRLGKMAASLDIEERIVAGLFLCSDQPNGILGTLKPEWNEKVQMSLKEKLLIIDYSLLTKDVFPWKDELSGAIDPEKFSESFLIQPDLFLRVRPGKMNAVLEKLRIADLRFQVVGENSLELPGSTKLEGVLEPDKEVVIQDYNSQQTGTFFKSEIENRIPIAIGTKMPVWDCCAGSGGKSIMAHDIEPSIDLIVSDVRESILANLRKRFEKAGIRNYESFMIDLVSDKSNPDSYRDPNIKSEIIICDAPCTGSGTWSRTPEQLYFFDKNEIEIFSSLQKRIVSNVIPHLQNGGSFIYITCSVFRKENEEVVEFIQEKFNLQLKQMEVLKGYDKKADSMFVALLRLPG